jgi:YVTN family beta-propeller protein
MQPSFLSASLAALLLLSACGSSDPLATPTAAGSNPVPPVPPVASKAVHYRAPAGTQKTAVSTVIDGLPGAILPNGRFVTPAGTEYGTLATKPFDFAVSPDEKWALTVNSGSPAASITLIGPLDGAAAPKNILLQTVFMGAAFSPDSSRFYVAGGDGGLVWVGDTASQAIIGSVNLNSREHSLTRPMTTSSTGAFTGGAFATRMALTRDGKTLYVLDQAGFAVQVIDTARIQTGTDESGAIVEPDNFDAVVGRAATGRYPFGIALSPDDQRLYVSNVGVLQFTSLQPETPANDSSVDFPYCFPVQGYPDDLGEKIIQIKPIDARNVPADIADPEGIRCGYVKEPRSYVVPPVGDPNAPEASSTFVYDLSSGTPQRIQVVKTGALVGELDEGIETHAGTHPNAVVVGSESIYVSNGSDDSVSVVDAATFKEMARIKLTPLTGYDAVLKGVQPMDLALSPDEKTLYVAEPGLNAVGVIDLARNQVIGHIPTAWWTSAVALSQDGKTLYATSARGHGSGPFVAANANTLGNFHVIPVPDATQLAAHTARVLKNNGIVDELPPQEPNPIPSQPGVASEQIKHVVFIFKENSKYDYLMGHIMVTTSGQVVDGLPAISLGAIVALNHTAIAQQFTFSDNFYLEPVVSSDGHRWLGGSYTTEFEETNWAAAYDGGGASNPSTNPETAANYPGRLSYPGSNGGPNPQDFNKHGGMFVHLARNGIPFFNFGLGLELTASDEGGGLEPTGMRMKINVPVETVLLQNTDHLYPTYNTAIPDSPLPNDPERFNRFGRFKQVFESRFVSGDECKMPNVMTLYYPNNHGGGANDIEPNWTVGRYVQDNDAAVGLTLEYLSHTPCWKNMVVFVTEDDTQTWVDHVDGSRVVNLAAGPWVKHGTVLKTHTSLSSMFKTAYLILGIPPLTMYDALATDLREMFTMDADFTPYTFITPVYQPTGNELPAGSAAAQKAAAWARLTADIDFSAPDRDEAKLNCAVMLSEGLLQPPLRCGAEGGDDD